MKEYPNELTVIFFYNLFVSIIAAGVGLITEKNSSAWKLRSDIALASVVCSVRYYKLAHWRTMWFSCSLHIHKSVMSNVHASPCLGTLWIVLEQYCSCMGFALERSCVCSDVQASVHCHCCCHGVLVPWRFSLSWKVWKWVLHLKTKYKDWSTNGPHCLSFLLSIYRIQKLKEIMSPLEYPVTDTDNIFVLCSLVGATIISVGFYTVMWGKLKEEMGDDCEVHGLESPPTNKVPLLQSYKNEQVRLENVWNLDY